MSYLASLNPLNLLGAMPGNVAQGLIWGLMALGVYITFRLLDFADLTVDGSFATGGAVTVVLILHGWSVPAALLIAILAGLAAGLITGLLHTLLGIPPILAGILTQIALYSINLNIMGMANLAVSVDQYPLLLSSRKITASILIALVLIAIVIMALYWYFGTEQGSAIRATGCNPAMSKAQGINISVTKVIGSEPVQRPCGSVRRLYGTVSGVCRHQHGARRHRHWPGRRHHRRGHRRGAAGQASATSSAS